MLIDHLNLVPCPICTETFTWNVDGITHENRIIDGTVTCSNGHSWRVSQEVLRLDEENANEEVIYFDRERTGYPSEVNEQERSDFLNFIDGYIKSLRFEKEHIVISGEPILYYRFLEDSSKQYITSYSEEKVLRQLHETAVRKRIHEKHSFVRSEGILTSESTNTLIIFPKDKLTEAPEKSVVLQFIPNAEDSRGRILWNGQKYKLEELKN